MPSTQPPPWWQFIERQLAARGWTQSDLARAIGVSSSSVSRWAVNTDPPRMDTIRAVSDALDLPIVNLMVEAGLIDKSEVPDGSLDCDVLTALAQDPKLRREDVKYLSALYRTMADRK